MQSASLITFIKNTQQLTDATWLSMQKVPLLNSVMNSAEMNVGSKGDLFSYFVSSVSSVHLSQRVKFSLYWRKFTFSQERRWYVGQD